MGVVVASSSLPYSGIPASSPQRVPGAETDRQPAGVPHPGQERIPQLTGAADLDEDLEPVLACVAGPGTCPGMPATCPSAIA
jgi:hypothetical protein